MATRIINAFHGSDAFYRYAYELDAAFRRGLGGWIPDPSFALSRDPEVWQKIRRDPEVDGAIAERLHMVAGRPRHAVPFDDGEKFEMAAQVTNGALKRVRRLADGQMQLAKAVMLGRAYGYVEGRRKRCELVPGMGERDWWVPTRIRNIDRLRIRFITREVSGRLRTFPEVYDINRSRWVVLPDLGRVVQMVYDDEEASLGYGRGMLESIFYYHYAKGVLLREGLNGAERFGQGTLVYKYQRESFAQVDTDTGDVVTKGLAVLRDLTSRNQAAIPDGDEIESIDPPSTGSDIIHRLLVYLDESMRRRITGSLLPGGGGSSTGSLARAQVEAENTEGIVAYDQGLLDDALTHGLIGTFWRLNLPILRGFGLDEYHMPKLEAKVEEIIDPEGFSTVVKNVWSANPDTPIRRDEFYKKLGLSAPDDNDDVITAPRREMAMAGVGAGGPGEDEPDDQRRADGGRDEPRGRQRGRGR